MLYLKLTIYSVFAVLLIGLTTHAQPTSQQNKKTRNLIYFGDLIDVDVLGSAEFDWRGTLNPEGYLDGIDFVEEPIYALCQNEETIAAEISKGFSKILRNPQVVVRVLDRSGRALSYLYGAVKFPQRFQIQRPVYLNELLILAGGIDEKASGEIQILSTNRLNCENPENFKSNSNESTNIQVTQKEFGTKTYKINISDLIRGNKDSNPLILNGDIITVTEAEPIYIIGGVNNPRKINAHSEITVSRAISSAGGVSKFADLKNIVIFRRKKNENIRLEIDFEKIKSGQSEDLILQKYDILEVGVKGGEKRNITPIVKIFESQTKPLEMPLRVIE